MVGKHSAQNWLPKLLKRSVLWVLQTFPWLQYSIPMTLCRMIAVLKFTFSNVILGLADVLTDLITFLFLLDEGHIAWALLTAQWMVTPFLIHAFDFIVR